VHPGHLGRHWSIDSLGLSKAELKSSRVCANCGTGYSVEEEFSSSPQYFPPPFNYAGGCLTNCLACWLGVGPEQGEGDEEFTGELLRECGVWLKPGVHLCVMPIARAVLDLPLRMADDAIFYPPNTINFETLRVHPNSLASKSLAEHIAATTKIDTEAIDSHVTVVFPIQFDWDKMWATGHKGQMEFIRFLSEVVDEESLNLLRYQECRIESLDALPARAGQVDCNHMMSAALVYKAASQQGRIIAGAAFTHFVTKGIGLPIVPIELDKFPGTGEVGCIAKRALSLYTALLEANSPSAKFVQAISLLEFLADPLRYRKFIEVKKIVARYVATTQRDYECVLSRFEDLTGKKDSVTGGEIGYRTRIVHIGDRLDTLLPNFDDRQKLFLELDGYIRPIIDHMIANSSLAFAEYEKVRDALCLFARS
jgi:hypothetical protein